MNFSNSYLLLGAVVLAVVAGVATVAAAETGGADVAETGVVAYENVSGAAEAVAQPTTYASHGC